MNNLSLIKSHRILPGPFFGLGVMCFFVVHQLFGDFSDDGRFRIGGGDQIANLVQNVTDGGFWVPIILQNIQTDFPTFIHITVIDSRREKYLRWLKGIILRKVNVQKEQSTFIRSPLWTQDGRLPLEKVFGGWFCLVHFRFGFSELGEFFRDSFLSHFLSFLGVFRFFYF